MERGDIWLVSLDPTSGHESAGPPQGRIPEGAARRYSAEQQGTRPVLIVSPSAFNRLTRTPIVLPITSGGSFARSAGFAVSLTGAGTRTTGIVRCDQPRALDVGSRHGRRLEAVPASIMDEVLARLAPLFE